MPSDLYFKEQSKLFLNVSRIDHLEATNKYLLYMNMDKHVLGIYYHGNSSLELMEEIKEEDHGKFLYNMTNIYESDEGFVNVYF